MVIPESNQNVLSRFAASGGLLDRLLHDLKQPLNQIRVVAQDLRIDVRKDRLKIDSLPESMEEIEKAVDELVLRLDRFRCFARSKPVESEPRRADLASICRSAISRIHDTSPDIEISETFVPDLGLVVGDPSIVEQALWELLDNGSLAATDAERNHPIMEVSTSRRGPEIVVGVLDNGFCVPDDERTRIFEPFFTTRQEAAGLGLPLAVALVGKIGGRIVLTRSDTEGSLFEILLPEPDTGAGLGEKA